MSKWSLQAGTISPVGVIDGTTIGTANFVALKGGTATQYIKIQEIQELGLAASSAVNGMLFSRDQTLSSTPTLSAPASLGPLDALTAVLSSPPVGIWGATSGGQRSVATTDAKLNLSFNAFGGILRWQAAPGEEWGQFGNTSAAPLGESSLSASSTISASPGAMGVHIIFEVI